ncbi:alpha/beta fold hydrolase [Pseudosulfitobacter sp. DSM 107133]|uniref:alpha/beta fold hydrolase n=1 Tax=Pseudosulfitobacter sp. DSM 107133 TaxID=2883100 RepID=UPI000DF16865|nr:alpha/beta fold hydrolase [Pseudosulfitobacter sp. DSM 107133]UOA26458.1 3-oxoadipate enol-lactonase 2 [Pseudosulfitobacter sp. DSM 107133]
MAEPLVLLPGMMCDARLYAAQLAAFSNVICVTIAPVTQGERVEEIASNLLDQLPKRFALAGLGFGAMVAMEILRRAPDRVSRIALISTNALAETPQSAAAREPLIVGARAGRLDEVMRTQLKPDHLAAGAERAGVLSAVAAMAQSLGPDVFVRQSRAMQRRRDQQSTLRKCKVPTLVMCGAQDSLTPVKHHSFIAELIPYAELVVIDGAGHLPPLEQPEETNAALQAWMKQPLVLRG